MRKTLLTVILAFAVFLAVAPLVLAVDTPPEMDTEWMHQVWSVIEITPTAIVSALFITVFGWKSRDPKEPYRLDYFIYTILISLGIGVFTLVFGWSYAKIEFVLANGMLTWFTWKTATIAANYLESRKVQATGAGPPA